MCELLRINYDRCSADPAKDKLCYKRGMFVSRRDDGCKWSQAEQGPGYDIVKLPGISKNHIDVLRLLERWEELKGYGPMGEPQMEMLGRRRLQHKCEEWTEEDKAYCENALVSANDRMVRLHSKCVDLTVK